ncbi:tRNA pseudouridine(38-40) synthase TruA [Peptococcaceae bacterium 1198_IL3148]
MSNIKLTVAYDGTDYYGFQEQRGTNFVTIQQLLEQSLSKLAKRSIQVIGASRTDSGVHARGQVVNFKSDCWPVPLNKLPLAVNALLPRDVAVTAAEYVADDFHARFSALGKTYTYTIYNHRIQNPFTKRFALHEPRPLDVGLMNIAAQCLLGEHDFKAFQAQGTPVKSTVRKIINAQVEKMDNNIILTVAGNGFLYNMVRIITGTLIQVGLGKLEPNKITDIISSKDRTKAGPTVPPQGLCLEEIYY